MSYAWCVAPTKTNPIERIEAPLLWTKTAEYTFDEKPLGKVYLRKTLLNSRLGPAEPLPAPNQENRHNTSRARQQAVCRRLGNRR